MPGPEDKGRAQEFLGFSDVLGQILAELNYDNSAFERLAEEVGPFYLDVYTSRSFCEVVPCLFMLRLCIY